MNLLSLKTHRPDDYPPQIGRQTACHPQEGSPRYRWSLGIAIGERAIRRTLALADRTTDGLDQVAQRMPRKVEVVTPQRPKSYLRDDVICRARNLIG